MKVTIKRELCRTALSVSVFYEIFFFEGIHSESTKSQQNLCRTFAVGNALRSIPSVLLLFLTPIGFTREFPYTMDVFSLDEANPWGFLFRNRNIIPEQFAGGLVALSPICLLALPAAIRYFIRLRRSQNSHATQCGAIGLTFLVLAVLIACIDGPFGVNARYLCDMTWLMLIGTMCLLFMWNTDARENGRRWLTVVIVALLIVGIGLQLLWLMTPGRSESWNISNPALYDWLRRLFTF